MTLQTTTLDEKKEVLPGASWLKGVGDQKVIDGDHQTLRDWLEFAKPNGKKR